MRLKDDNSGKPYYWNRRTRASAWQPPPGVKVVWNGERNEEGLVWYWHRETRVSTFDLPPSSSWVKCCTASPGRYINTGRSAYLPVTMQRLVPAVLRASWTIWTRRTVAVVCTRRVLLVTMHLALYSLPWLAGPECSAFWPVRT